jgi:hypothetical protein
LPQLQQVQGCQGTAATAGSVAVTELLQQSTTGLLDYFAMGGHGPCSIWHDVQQRALKQLPCHPSPMLCIISAACLVFHHQYGTHYATYVNNTVAALKNAIDSGVRLPVATSNLTGDQLRSILHSH